MIRYPAIALIEISSIATGIFCADAMIKRAPITMMKSGTVHNGKYLILIGGSVAAAEEAYLQGLALASAELIDHVFLPDVHEQVHEAVFGTRTICVNDAIGIIDLAAFSSSTFSRVHVFGNAMVSSQLGC